MKKLRLYVGLILGGLLTQNFSLCAAVEKEARSVAVKLERSKRAKKTRENVIFIDDQAYDEANSGLGDVSKGFSIDANTKVIWAVQDHTKKVDGPITWADESAVFELDKDLYLGPNAALIGAYYKINKIYVATLDGNGKNIVLGNNMNLTGIALMSDIAFDGQGSFSITMDNTGFAESSGLFYGYSADVRPNLKFKNMTLNFSADANRAFLYNPFYALNKVYLKNTVINTQILNGEYGFPLSFDVKNGFSVDCNCTIKRINSDASVRLGDYDTSTPLTIKSGASLLIDCRKFGNVASVAMADESSLLTLRSTVFCSGAEGMVVDGGIVKYDGAVQLYNGNVGENLNADPQKALVFNDSVAEEYMVNAVRDIHGYFLDGAQLYLGIHDDNLAYYRNGLTIGANTIVLWDTDGIMNGKVRFAGPTSVLSLEENLALSDSGQLFNIDGTIPNNGTLMTNGYVVVQKIGDMNVEAYSLGMVIPANTVMLWSVSDPEASPISSITWTDQSSLFRLANDIYLGGGALTGGQFYATSAVFFDGQGYTLHLTDDTRLQAKYVVGKTNLIAVSGLTIDGHGNAILCVDSDSLISWNSNGENLSLQDVAFEYLTGLV